MESMIVQDIVAGRGLAVIDPHVCNPLEDP